MYITPDSIITAGGVLATITSFIVLFRKVFLFLDKINDLEKRVIYLEQKHAKEIRSVKEEQQLVIYGLLACLKGLQEQGCNGSVSEAINKIEKYVNDKAHKGADENE